ncbi:MAG: HPr family phosphocarrier protein [Lachnospiraceae bacterium]|nr:HPr family phosphocarrier protein [Lachnospiraceae bacterium]
MIQKSIQIHLFDDADFSPAAKLVQVANRYASSIYLETSAGKVNAKSIMGMMSLALQGGDEVTVSADGADEADAVSGIEAFLCG